MTHYKTDSKCDVAIKLYQAFCLTYIYSHKRFICPKARALELYWPKTPFFTWKGHGFIWDMSSIYLTERLFNGLKGFLEWIIGYNIWTITCCMTDVSYFLFFLIANTFNLELSSIRSHWFGDIWVKSEILVGINNKSLLWNNISESDLLTGHIFLKL